MGTILPDFRRTLASLDFVELASVSHGQTVGQRGRAFLKLAGIADRSPNPARRPQSQGAGHRALAGPVVTAGQGNGPRGFAISAATASDTSSRQGCATT